MTGEHDGQLERIAVDIPDGCDCAQCGAVVTPGARDWRMIELQYPGARIRFFFCPREFPAAGATLEQYDQAYERCITKALLLLATCQRRASKATTN